MSLAQLLEPLNTRTTSNVGVGIMTTAGASLVKCLTSASWLEGLWYALHAGHTATPVDPTPIFQLVAIGFGFVLGAIALYIGAPWFITPTPTGKP